MAGCGGREGAGRHWRRRRRVDLDREEEQHVRAGIIGAYWSFPLVLQMCPILERLLLWDGGSSLYWCLLYMVVVGLSKTAKSRIATFQHFLAS
jgi:hypothetical protein